MFDHRMNKVSIGQDLSTKKLPVSKKYENVKAVTKTGKIVTKAAENWEELNLNVRYRKNEHFRRIRADTLVSLLHAEDDEVGLEAERTKPPRDFVPWRLATNPIVGKYLLGQSKFTHAYVVLTSSLFFSFFPALLVDRPFCHVPNSPELSAGSAAGPQACRGVRELPRQGRGQLSYRDALQVDEQLHS